MAGKLTDKQKRFIEEYCVDFNATQAAIRAGYSQNTAYSIGEENLRKPDIIGEIKERLESLTLSADETTKMIADMAKANISDYLVKKTVEHTPRVRKGLQELIDELEYRLQLEEEFCAEKGYTEKEYDDFQEQLQPIRDKILRYRIELRNNPSASRIVNGETEFIEVYDLDIEKIKEDKQFGKVKSFKHGKYGIEVELYASDAALDRLAKIHGLYKDNLKVDADINGSISPENWLMLQGKK